MNVTFPKAREIFLEALKLSPTEWTRYLENACGDDLALRERLDHLLHAHQEAGSLPGFTSDVAIDHPTDPLGTLIGPYKLLEMIGEGGFGVVFMAEQQEPVRRKVALKVIKPGMDTRHVVARFEAERQALALMDHPNIAKVFDGGEAASGRPFFVMELVRGAPITNFCDQKQLNVRARLELFVSVCQAVQHAHQKGVIHRDLKPSNILVTLHDGTPVVKVIDFGIAKAMGEQLTDKTLFTRFAQMMGTPLYMSPEQAELSGLDVDTRTDIYSLGVLLYELLTGTTPFDKDRLRSASYDEIRRIIREDEPPLPSTRISTLGQATTEVSANRQSDPQRLRQVFHGELDWIVMRALEKDRNRRYESAGDLAADVKRYLHDEPVQACPPSTWYRFQKFAKRNRVALTSASVVIAILILGTLVSAWQAVRARHAERQSDISLAAEKQARKDAEANLAKARQVVDQYLTLTSESRLLDVPGLQPLRKELLEAAVVYYQDFLKQHPRDPQLQADLAAAYLRMGQIYTAIGSNSEGLTALDQGVKLVESLRSEHPNEPDWQIRLAGTHKLGRDMHYGSEGPAAPAAALDVLQRAIQLWEPMALGYPDVFGFRSDLAAFHTIRADLELVLGRQAPALSAYRQASDLWGKLIAEYPRTADYRVEQSRTLDGIGKVLERLHRPQEAEESYRQSLQLRQGLVTEFPDRSDYEVEVAYAELRLARLLPAERVAEAEATVRRAQGLLAKLVAQLPTIPSLKENLGICHYDQARYLRQMGRADEAIAACRESLAISERLRDDFPSQHSYRDRCASRYRDLAVMLIDAAQPEEAERYYAQSVEAMQLLVAEVPQQVVYRRRLTESYIGQGHLLWIIGRRKEAATAYRRAIELRQGVLDELPDVPLYVRELARLLATCPVPELRDTGRAIELANQAIRLTPEESAAWYTLGAAYYADGNWPAALTALEKSAEKGPGGDSSDWLVAAIWLVRAMASWQLSLSQDVPEEEQARHQAEARQWYARAVESLEKYKPVDNEPRRLRAEAAELLEKGTLSPPNF